MDRKAPKQSRLSHASTPYARPATPARNRRDEQDLVQTPGGSIFSKVLSIFTPSRWASPSGSFGANADFQYEGKGQGLVDEGLDQAEQQIARQQPEVSNAAAGTAANDTASSTPSRYLPYLFSPARRSSIAASASVPIGLVTPGVQSSQSTYAAPGFSTELPPSSAQAPSPNQKLADFFQKKGDAPLSEIEMEGVLALMKQAQQEQEDTTASATFTPAQVATTVATSTPTGFASFEPKVPFTQPRPAPGSPSITAQLYPSIPSFATPSRHRRTGSLTPNVRAPRYNPILTPQPHRLNGSRTPIQTFSSSSSTTIATTTTSSLSLSSSSSSSSTASLSRPGALPSVSTPFRSRSRPSTPGSSNTTKRIKVDAVNGAEISSRRTPAFSLLPPAPPPPAPPPPSNASPVNASALQAVVESTPKRLSQTASALLSLIEPVGTPTEVAKAREEDRKRLIDPKLQPFVNPYATSSPSASTSASISTSTNVATSTSTPGRRRGSSRRETLGGTGLRKRTAIEEIERTVPVDEQTNTITVSAFEAAVATATPVPKKTTQAQENVQIQEDHEVKTPTPAGGSAFANTATPSSSSSLIDRFRPHKSSQLRESIVLSPPVSPSKSVENEHAPVNKPLTFSFTSQQSISTSQAQPIVLKPIQPAVTTFSAPVVVTAAAAAVNGNGNGNAGISKPSAKIEQNPHAAKALESDMYKAYIPKYYFAPPASVTGANENGSSQEEAKTKALLASETEVSKYEFTFPAVSV
ncbi:hypothetical protein V1514DRAFT_333427 [Lipomyces japonicus]|uniref:uncharacterized protein n=1 Tax=Lipomyces japonicus TaxID=56871 RepID=UPI0034CD9753